MTALAWILGVVASVVTCSDPSLAATGISRPLTGWSPRGEVCVEIVAEAFSIRHNRALEPAAFDAYMREVTPPLSLAACDPVVVAHILSVVTEATWRAVPAEGRFIDVHARIVFASGGQPSRSLYVSTFGDTWDAALPAVIFERDDGREWVARLARAFSTALLGPGGGVDEE